MPWRRPSASPRLAAGRSRGVRHALVRSPVPRVGRGTSRCHPGLSQPWPRAISCLAMSRGRVSSDARVSSRRCRLGLGRKTGAPPGIDERCHVFRPEASLWRRSRISVPGMDPPARRRDTIVGLRQSEPFCLTPRYGSLRVSVLGLSPRGRAVRGSGGRFGDLSVSFVLSVRSDIEFGSSWSRFSEDLEIPLRGCWGQMCRLEEDANFFFFYVCFVNYAG